MDTKPFSSTVIAGCMNWGQWGARFDTNAYLSMIHACLDEGVTTFDHADIYGHYTTEEEFGRALAQEPGLRARLQLITKCGIRMVTPNRPDHQIKSYDTSAAHIRASLERSLKNLHTDHVDLLLIHRPDPLMDFDEVAGAFERLRQQGKVKHFGVSNFSRHQFESLNRRIALATNQVEFSPLFVAPMFDETLDGLQDLGVAPMIWSPLAGGRLFSSDEPAAQRVRAVVQRIADELQRPFSSVVFAWIMQLPSRPIPLTGSGRIAAIAEAVQATQFSLSRSQWFEILRAARGHEVA